MPRRDPIPAVLLDAIAELCDMRDRWQVYELAIARQLQGTVGERTPSPGPSDSTLARVIARQPADDRWQATMSALARIRGDARRVGAFVSREIARSLTVEEAAQISAAHRCTGGGTMAGALEWGRPECPRTAVTRDGLCDPCDQRRRRWRRERAA